MRTIANRRGITNYSRLGRTTLTELLKKEIKNAPVEEVIEIVDKRDALKGVFCSIVIKPLKQQDLERFFQIIRSTISKELESTLAQKKALKVQIVLTVGLVKSNPATGGNINVYPNFRSYQVTITHSSELDYEISLVAEKEDNMAKYMRDGSELTCGKVDQLEIHLDKFKPLAGKSYIPLPQKLTKKKA